MVIDFLILLFSSGVSLWIVIGLGLEGFLGGLIMLGTLSVIYIVLVLVKEKIL